MSQKTVQTKLTSGRKKLSGDLITTGPCQFPFKYKGELHNECYKGKYGDWCATEVHPESRKMLKYAFCDYGDSQNISKPTVKLSKKMNASKNIPAKNPTNDSKPNSKSTKKVPFKRVKKTKTAVKNTKTVTKKNNTNIQAKPSSPKVRQNNNSNQIPKKKTVKRRFKVKDPTEGIAKTHLVVKEASIQPKIWELPNRKTFPNWMFTTFKPYLAVKNSLKTAGKGIRFKFFKHQQLVRDYLQMNSPYRGLLLYHGLGVGKTCASIGIAEGFSSDRKIVILLNKSLKNNFRVNLMKCGFDYFRTNQHWIFMPLTKTDNLYHYIRHLGLSRQFVEKHGGCMIVDFSKRANYDTLSNSNRELLHNQIDVMINNKYEFIHLDGLNKKKLEKMVENRVLDNKFLIIDEVHNLTNAMAKSNPGHRASYLEELIMDADNLKCVFLSGTPMINKLIEAGKVFNLLRGYIVQFVFKLKQTTVGQNTDKLDDVLQRIVETGYVDQYFINKKENTIMLTRTPNKFKTLGNEGLVFDTSYSLVNTQFINIINTIIMESGYTSSMVVEKHTAFPNDETKFLSLFFDPVKNNIRNPKLFQSRIMGMISYFKTSDRRLLPEVTVDTVERVPMSKYQFLNYSNIRKKEIEQDKNKGGKKAVKKLGKNKQIEENVEKSSYRAYSRMHCSFVFPESIKRPYPSDKLNEEEKQVFENTTKYLLGGKIVKDNIDGDMELDDIMDNLNIEKKAMLKQYENSKTKILKELDTQKETYLVVNDEDKLPKYSPKYNLIVDRILKKSGTIFVYTEYRSLEGISVFKIVLKANGFAPFLLEKTDDGDYQQIYENSDDVDKPKYALWGGDPEMSDIVRKVYNNEFDLLPPKLVDQLLKTSKTNIRGETIKVLLTTKTGAEGIDLKNVRQVHIVEPFWNPVRINQVKGRAVRVASHVELPPAERTVEIYSYISYMTKEQLKTDRILSDDSNGNSSDEVLYNISARKLELMNDLLKLIKESSIDCLINSAETTDSRQKLSCVTYGGNKLRDYSYLPDIQHEVVDSDKNRRIKKTTWKPIFIKIPIGGKLKEFALKKSDRKEVPSLLYNADDMRFGIVGIPLGEYTEMSDGKKKIKMYKYEVNC